MRFASIRRVFVALVLAAGLPLAAAPGAFGQGHAPGHGGHSGHHGAANATEVFIGGDIVVRDVWVPAPPGGAKVAAGYLVIENKGSQPERLLGGTFGLAGRVEVHEMTNIDGVMRMRPIEPGLDIPAGGRVVLESGGTHLMLMDLKEPLKAGDRFAGKLHFEKLGLLPVMLEVRSRGSGAHHGSGHH